MIDVFYPGLQPQLHAVAISQGMLPGVAISQGMHLEGTSKNRWEVGRGEVVDVVWCALKTESF